MSKLFLSRTSQTEADRLAEIAHREKWSVEWIGPRSGLPIRAHEQVALYAETDLAVRTAARLGLALLEPSLDQVAKLPERYTRRTIRYLTLDEARRLEVRTFIKPADCARKVFEADVFESGRHLRCPSYLPGTTPLLASEPVRWDEEFRVIVLEREVATFSPYLRGARTARNTAGDWPYSTDEAAEVLALARAVLADDSVALPPAFALDVGRIEDRGWAVIEFNPVWCSGFYGGDLERVLPALQRACRLRSELDTDDANWVIDRPESD